MERESMAYDVVIVGAGPAGLAAAYRLKSENDSLSVCVVEKGSEVGAHILSGAVFETSALDELIPDWSSKGAPVKTAVTTDNIYYFNNSESAYAVPYFLSPKTMHNDDNFIISLGNFCRWLAEQAEAIGVEIFPGFSAADILMDDDNRRVLGIVTGEMGRARNGDEKDGFVAGMALEAKYTLFAEGARGHLGKQLISHFQLDAGKDPQHFGLGIKELWKIPTEQ